MKRVRIHAILLVSCLLLILTVASANKKLRGNYPVKSYPIADGTFIQDNLVANWDDTRWQQELSALCRKGFTCHFCRMEK
ncbi:MAG: hypothetical protein Q8859_13225 [Bacteroidota bacterium]|nr:hypothetical protein [Bacteroidota bacterium]